MTTFLEYKTAKGKRWSLLPEQIRGLEDLSDATRIYASIAGQPISFQVKRDYDDVKQELDKAREERALNDA